MLRHFPTVREQFEVATDVLLDSFAADPAMVRHLFVPYRICPLGAHIDHQGGHVLGRIINAGTVFAYVPVPKPEIQLSSTNFEETLTFPLGARVQPDHWARYAQAAALAMDQEHSLSKGFIGVSGGPLLGAGLSSSASVGLVYLQALADVNGILPTIPQLVELDYQLEHTHLGLQNGVLDQSSILYGQEDSLVYIDTGSRQAHLIPDPPEMEEACWLIIFSGVRRELTKGGGFNQRVAECQAAAQWLSARATILADVPQELFDNCAVEMPEDLRRRAAHYFGEVARVTEGVQAWKDGDMARFGRLMNESCASSIDYYESGGEEIIALQRVTSSVKGVYGSRFSGGGYGGCVIALVDRKQAEEVAVHILQMFDNIYPALAASAAVYLVENREVA